MEAALRRTIISQALGGTGVASVHWAMDGAHPGKGGIASVGGDYMRLILVVDGERRIRFRQEEKVVAMALRARDCLVVGPHAWVATDPVLPFVSIGVVLEARNPRFVLARHRLQARSAQGVVREAEVEIVPGLCDDITMHLAAALLAGRNESEAEHYLARLADALWLRLARATSRASGAAGKASVTYGALEHYVRENFNRPIHRKGVARALRLSPSHVTRLFLAFAGETFGGFLLRVRLENARRLLRDPRLTVSEAGYLAGFASVNYFVRAYRLRYGTTPGRDRR